MHAPPTAQWYYYRYTTSSTACSIRVLDARSDQVRASSKISNARELQHLAAGGLQRGMQAWVWEWDTSSDAASGNLLLQLQLTLSLCGLAGLLAHVCIVHDL